MRSCAKGSESSKIVNFPTMKFYSYFAFPLLKKIRSTHSSTWNSSFSAPAKSGEKASKQFIGK